MSQRHFDPATTALLPRYGAPPFEFVDCRPAAATSPRYLEQALLNALSIPLPWGERFFIRTMRDCLAQLALSPALQDDIRLFISQESAHLREHSAYNQRLCKQQGYSLARLEFPIRFNFDEVERTRSLRHRLAMTVCLEHITTVLAEAVLWHPEWLQQASEPFRQLWKWHALEELDHRALAFELYLSQGHDRSYLHDVMRELGPRQVRFLEAVLCAMAEHDGCDGAKARQWFRQDGFVCASGGPAAFFRERVEAFYAPGFDPRTHIGLDGLV